MPEVHGSGIPAGCNVLRSFPVVSAALRPPATLCDPFGIKATAKENCHTRRHRGTLMAVVEASRSPQSHESMLHSINLEAGREMSTHRTLPVLLCLLVTLVLAQQLLARRMFQASELQQARDRSHFERIATTAELAEREQLRRDELWIGRLYDDTEQSVPNDLERPEFRPPPGAHRIAGRIDFEEESLAVNLELHECQPGSSLCATGGTLTVFNGDRPLCVISVGILQAPSDGIAQSHYRVSWQPHADGISITNPERIHAMHQLAGKTAIPDRSRFFQLLRAGYADESRQNSAPLEESLEKQLIRAICRAIVRSRSALKSQAEHRDEKADE